MGWVPQIRYIVHAAVKNIGIESLLGLFLSFRTILISPPLPLIKIPITLLPLLSQYFSSFNPIKISLFIVVKSFIFSIVFRSAVNQK